MYQVAREYTRSAQLDRENQLLAVESRRYTELRAYMEQTRHLRHDFRQHLHVISGLTEAGQLEELKSYLCQYESELSEERPTLCANPAVDALAGHYDHEARQLGVPVEWRLELPRQLPVPEADLCMMLGNLLENAFHASQKLPPEQRQVKVMARMLSPAMLGLLVENRYDGVLKRQKGALHSTKHDGMGIGLVSIPDHRSQIRRLHDRRDRKRPVPSEYFIEPLTSQSRIRSTAPLTRGASGEEIKLYEMPKPPLVRSNNDDRRQWRKQEVAVGAAASKTQAKCCGCWVPQPGQWHCEAMTERLTQLIKGGLHHENHPTQASSALPLSLCCPVRWPPPPARPSPTACWPAFSTAKTPPCL